MSEVILRLSGIAKKFGSTKVIDDLELMIHRGEIFTLLGPSGCGKSTTLRIIAGLEHPDSGEVVFSKDEVWVSTNRRIFKPPQSRKIGMVFQSYAIWPHMTVFDNVAYPLRVQKKSLDKVEGVLNKVGLDGLAQRPSQDLSGGQQQRVALARALVSEPDILLLDEPFSNLDVKLRESVRIELKGIQEEFGLTVVLVTHDQLDAFSLSDRIGVMRDGRIEQIGTGIEIYEKPLSDYVRDFVGKTVFIEGEISERMSNGILISIAGKTLFIGEDGVDKEIFSTTDLADVKIALRPEDVQLLEDDENQCGVKGRIGRAVFLGDHFEYQINLADGQKITSHQPRSRRFQEGMEVFVHFSPDVATVWKK